LMKPVRREASRPEILTTEDTNNQIYIQVFKDLYVDFK
jgi:hypothetical protein